MGLWPMLGQLGVPTQTFAIGLKEPLCSKVTQLLSHELFGHFHDHKERKTTQNKSIWRRTEQRKRKKTVPIKVIFDSLRPVVPKVRRIPILFLVDAHFCLRLLGGLLPPVTKNGLIRHYRSCKR